MHLEAVVVLMLARWSEIELRVRRLSSEPLHGAGWTVVDSLRAAQAWVLRGPAYELVFSSVLQVAAAVLSLFAKLAHFLRH